MLEFLEGVKTKNKKQIPERNLGQLDPFQKQI